MNPGDEMIIDDCWNRIGIWRTSGEACEKIETYVHCRNCPVYAQAGKTLLDRPLNDQQLDEHTITVHDHTPDETNILKAFSIFRIGHEWFGMDVDLLSEICPIHEIHRLPHNRDSFLKGLINVHGSIVVCMSVGALLGKTAADRADDNYQTSRMLIMHIGNDRIAFPVTETSGSLRLDENKLGEPPAPNKLSKTSIVKGMHRTDDRDIGIIDREKLITSIQEHLA